MDAKSPDTQKHTPGLSRPCNPRDVFISGNGYQCGNCLAFAAHSWDLHRAKAEGGAHV